MIFKRIFNAILKSKNSESDRLLHNTIMLYLLQFSSIIFPLFTFPYLTRVLGPNIYGIIVFANAIMIYFQQFIDFGFILSGTLQCSIYRDQKCELSKITISIIQIKVIISLLGWLFLIVISTTFEVFADKSLYILLSYLPISFAAFIPDFLFRGIERMSIITYRTLTSSLIYTLSIFFIIRKPDDYIFLPLLNLLSVLIIIIWSWIYLINNKIIFIKPVNYNYTLKIFKESIMFFFSRIATSIYGASNIFILGAVGISNNSLGNYGVSNNLVNVIKSMFTPIVDSIYPYLIKSKNYRLIWRLLAILMPIIILFTFLLYILSDEIIVLLSGHEFKSASPLFVIMLPLIIIALPTYLLGFPTLGAMGKSSKANSTVIVGSIFHIIVLIILLSTNNISVINIIYLTIITELLIVSLRIFYIVKK